MPKHGNLLPGLVLILIIKIKIIIKRG